MTTITSRNITPPHNNFDQIQSKFSPIFTEIAAGAIQRELERELLFQPIRTLTQAGFGALRVPQELGGFGLSIPELFTLLIDLAAADSNIPQALRAHFFITEFFRINAENRWLEVIASGKIFGNAFTERGTGAIQEYSTTLTPVQDGYILHGTKYYSTGTLYSDYFQVTANLSGKRAIAIVKTDSSGVSAIDDWTGFGQRLTASGTTILDNVFVSAENVYPTADQEPTFNTAFLQLVHLAGLAGIIQRAATDVSDWVRARNRTFSHSVSDLPREDPLVQQIIGKLSGVSFTARATVLAVAEILGEILDVPGNSNNTELIAQGEIASGQAQITLIPLILGALNELFEVGGASIVDDKYRFDRHWRNARTLGVHNPAIFKARVIGDYLLNGTPLSYQWQAGEKNSHPEKSSSEK